MPGVTKEEFRSRRARLCHIISELVASRANDFNHLVVIPAAPKKYMTENIPYPYRQNSNFFYLSGSYDPGAFIVMCINGKEQTHALFLSDPDAMSELWDGPMTNPSAAIDHFGFDEAFVASQFERFIGDFAKMSHKKTKVWCEDRSIVEKYLNPSFGFEFKNTESPKAIIDTLRVIKSPSEVNLMRESANISAKAFQRTIKFCAELHAKGEPVNERQIWAKLDFECRHLGAERLAYPPVVAGGSRANVIHYVFNNNTCLPNELVLVDAGCEYYGCCSDITRTWPVSGKFENDRQRSLYQMMLSLQTGLIKRVKPGLSLDRLFRIMNEQLLKGLQELGIIEKGLGTEGRLQDHTHEIALRFCPHHVSHYLGMDVHDTTTIMRDEPLVPGMVVTVEPGVYLRASSNQSDFLTKVGREFSGLAIRIEDDVLITQDGCSVLTSGCPKTIEDIELWGRVPQR